MTPTVDTEAKKPTTDQYSAYQRMFDHFNQKLFNGRLPPVLLSFSRKGRRNHGFFAPERWTGEGSPFHEISLNPENLHRDREEVMSTLVHEMVHLEQRAFGTPGKAGNHNRQWGEWMDRVGLTPSNTGAPGGKRTGVQMTHYVVQDGPFQLAAKEVDYLPLLSAPAPRKQTKNRNKVRYSCGCKIRIWGKSDLNVVCGECGKQFVEGA